MRALRRLFIAGATVPVLILSAPTLHGFDRAANLNRTTILRFATDIQLPGRRLPAGSYTFELADPLHARELVTISSRDRRNLVLTMFTRIVNRPATLRDGTPVSFGEDVNGALVVAAWWPAGEGTGREFIYRD